jgi:hypothetical protein
MKFTPDRPFANGVEAVQDGRIFIERVNAPFLVAGGTGDDFRAGIERAVALGWLWRHESGITEFRDNTVFVLFE